MCKQYFGGSLINALAVCAALPVVVCCLCMVMDSFAGQNLGFKVFPHFPTLSNIV
jgi:hypothetical protein